MRSLVVVALVGACGGSQPPAGPRQPPPPAERPPAPAVAPAPDPYANLDLGFEDGSGAAAKRWTRFSIAGYELAVVDDVAHGGKRSFRIRGTGGGPAAATNVSFDATPVRGKKLRLHGWIKTDGVTAGWAGVWIRAEGGKRTAADNMFGRGVTGTADWREATVEVDVPADAGLVIVGPMLAGPGSAWFDDLRIEIADIPAPKPIALAGIVVDAAGKPVAGAQVTLIRGGDVEQHVTTGADGRFELRTTAGKLGVSAHHASGVGVFIAQAEYGADRRDLRLALGASGGVTVAGKITGGTVKPGTFIATGPISPNDADIFAVAVGADGRFSAVLPRGDEYYVNALDQALGTGSLKRKGDRADGEIRLSVMTPPPAEVVDWIKANGAPLQSAEAGHGFTDMAAVGKLVGKARIVGLGEATHGTREFFQLKHRVLEYLVARHGFTLFAIEANQPECRAINDYVLNGKGDPKAALDGVYFWTWNTEEVLAMIEWMRAWNAGHKKKVQFAGFDMQTSKVAHDSVTAFVARAGGDAALLRPVAVLGGENAPDAVAQLAPPQRAEVERGLAALARAFDANQKAWRAKAGGAAFDDARHDVTILDQAFRMYSATNDPTASTSQFHVRDRSMADNVKWLLEHQPRGGRIVLWAHNGHVSHVLETYPNMGSHLDRMYKRDYVPIGFVFGQGSFQAMDWTTGRGGGLAEHTLGPAPEHDVSTAFSRAGMPLLVLDLRRLPNKGPVREWFDAPHARLETGAVFISQRQMTVVDALPRKFDAVIYVDKTTRARPVHAQQRAPGTEP